MGFRTTTITETNIFLPVVIKLQFSKWKGYLIDRTFVYNLVLKLFASKLKFVTLFVQCCLFDFSTTRLQVENRQLTQFSMSEHPEDFP